MTAESFVYDGIEVSPQELFDRYASSPHGEFQSRQDPRFAQIYNYEPFPQFIEDLGDDVHPVRHMIHTHDTITVPLLRYQRYSHKHPPFSDDHEAELRTAAVLHDIGECEDSDILENVGFTLGDVAYGTMAEDHKEKEKIIRGYLYDKYFHDVPERLLNRVDQIDLKETKDIAVMAFEVIERVGYYLTSRRAAEIVIENRLKYQQGDERIAQLARLATIVSFNHREFLQTQVGAFPYVNEVLSK